MRGKRIVGVLFPEDERDLDDKNANPFEQDEGDSYVDKNLCTGKAKDLGFVRMQKSGLAEELVFSEADLRTFSFRRSSVPRNTSTISLGNLTIDICFVKPW